MRYARCPNRQRFNPMYPCNELYIAGRDVWSAKAKRIIKVPEQNFTNCPECGAELVEALDNCGCVGVHSEACKTYCGPD